MKKPKSDYVIQTVVHALSVLESFDTREDLGVTELAERLDLHKNNVFRLLATLQERGYIEQAEDTQRYRLGVRCAELGQSFARTHGLVRQARPFLEELARATRESVHLSVLRDFEVVHLDGEASKRLVGSGARLGSRLPAHCTASGKVLLGCAEPRLREEYDRLWVSAGRLEGRTRATILDREKLFEELRVTAGRGFALDLGECEEGMHCAAVPVHDASGRPAAALSLSGPAFRLGDERLVGDIVPGLTQSAERLSARLGYVA